MASWQLTHQKSRRSSKGITPAWTLNPSIYLYQAAWPNARRVEKVAISDQYLAIARKRLMTEWVHAAMRLTSIESSFHPILDLHGI